MTYSKHYCFIQPCCFIDNHFIFATLISVNIRNCQIMRKPDNNDDLQTRREFFKKAAKSVLPILGTICILNTPFRAQAKKIAMGCDDGSCQFECMTTCREACSNDCTFGCGNTCYDSCIGCRETCRGSCDGSCSGCSGTCSAVCGYDCMSSCSGGCSMGCYTGCFVYYMY